MFSGCFNVRTVRISNPSIVYDSYRISCSGLGSVTFYTVNACTSQATVPYSLPYCVLRMTVENDPIPVEYQILSLNPCGSSRKRSIELPYNRPMELPALERRSLEWPSLQKRSIDGTHINGMLLLPYLHLLGKASQVTVHAEEQYLKSKRDVVIPVEPEPQHVQERRQIVHPQLVSKDSWMAVWYEDTFAQVLDFFSGGGNNTLDDKVQFLKDWFENTNISPYGEHGFWFYITFPFICHNPENLDCSMGFGLPEGIVWTITYFLIVVLILSFVD